MRTPFFIGATLAACAIASPLKNRAFTTVTVFGTTTTTYAQPAWEVQGFPIHGSCNGTERRQLEKALGDTIKIAQQAAQHIYNYGPESSTFRKYFGKAPTAEVIGWYEKVVYGDRTGILFRCDDIDGNCEQPGWGGHWRGENGTQETVICPLSYQTRHPLEALCGDGYTVANGALNYYFASDLLHRLYHVPKIGEGVTEHYADSYAECLELAQQEPAKAVRNTHTLQYFALEVYAFEVALPGEGCTGVPSKEDSGSPTASASAAATTAVTSAAATATAVTSQVASKTTSAATECHTHADGEVHCV